MVEFCAGGALVDRLGELDAEQQRSVAEGVASGVRHLHLEHVVHRDLAARNILLHEKGGELIAKVADFGMARQVDPAAESQNKTRSAVSCTVARSPHRSH